MHKMPQREKFSDIRQIRGFQFRKARITSETNRPKTTQARIQTVSQKPETLGLPLKGTVSQSGMQTAKLRLLHTTDNHMAILPYDYFADRPANTMGLTRTATLIRAARAEAQVSGATCLLLEGGDFLQGNPMGDFLAQQHAKGSPTRPHPMMAAMNALSYDVATLGNHEFNFGLEYLRDVLEQAEFPFVCSNVILKKAEDPAQDHTMLPPWTMLERDIILHGPDGPQPQKLRIGILGVTPPQVALWDRRHLRGRACTRDMVESARAHLPALRAAGTDIVIALNHSGIHGRKTAGMAENAGLDLAAIDGIDVVLCGHQHALFPGTSDDFQGLAGVDPNAGTLHGKPALMSGFWGAHLGILDLDLTRDAAGRWSVGTHHAQHRATYRRDTNSQPVALVQEDPDLHRIANPAHQAALNYIRQPVGETAHPLHSYFALLGNERSVQTVAEAQRWRVAELLEDGPLSRLPLLSAAAPFKTGGHSGPEHYTDIPKGPLNIRNLADLYQFPNDLRVVQVTGANLRDWLERAAGQFLQITAGMADQCLRDRSFASYNFDVIMGLQYQIDLGQPTRFDHSGDIANPDAHRITNLTYAGKPLRDDQLFLVATNSYRAGGGGSFAGASGDSVVMSVPESSFEVLRKYVAAQDIVNLPTCDVWRFAPMRGTSVLLDTNPRALSFLHELDGARIEPAGPGATGYTRLRLHL